MKTCFRCALVLAMLCLSCETEENTNAIAAESYLVGAVLVHNLTSFNWVAGNIFIDTPAPYWFYQSEYVGKMSAGIDYFMDDDVHLPTSAYTSYFQYADANTNSQRFEVDIQPDGDNIIDISDTGIAQSFTPWAVPITPTTPGSSTTTGCGTRLAPLIAPKIPREATPYKGLAPTFGSANGLSASNLTSVSSGNPPTPTTLIFAGT